MSCNHQILCTTDEAINCKKTETSNLQHTIHQKRTSATVQKHCQVHDTIQLTSQEFRPSSASHAYKVAREFCLTSCQQSDEHMDDDAVLAVRLLGDERTDPMKQLLLNLIGHESCTY